MIGNYKVSLITGCRNRASFLLQTIMGWLSEPTVDEIVVVDWSSDPPLEPQLSKYLNNPHTGPFWSDPDLRLAVALNQEIWHLTRCYNLGLQVATGDLILKLDADVRLGHQFFRYHPIEPGQFYAGDAHGMRAPLWGNTFAFREDLLKVNGWNERLIGYGWDDEDLYGRLSRSGLERKHMNYSTLGHIDHSDDIRRDPKGETFEESTHRNVRMSSENPWTKDDQMSQWQMTRTGNVILCRQVP